MLLLGRSQSRPIPNTKQQYLSRITGSSDRSHATPSIHQCKICHGSRNTHTPASWLFVGSGKILRQDRGQIVIIRGHTEGAVTIWLCREIACIELLEAEISCASVPGMWTPIGVGPLHSLLFFVVICSFNTALLLLLVGPFFFFFFFWQCEFQPSSNHPTKSKSRLHRLTTLDVSGWNWQCT